MIWNIESSISGGALDAVRRSEFSCPLLRPRVGSIHLMREQGFILAREGRKLNIKTYETSVWRRELGKMFSLAFWALNRRPSGAKNNSENNTTLAWSNGVSIDAFVLDRRS